MSRLWREDSLRGGVRRVSTCLFLPSMLLPRLLLQN